MLQLTPIYPQNEEDQRDGAGLQLELARSQKSCQELEDKNQVNQQSTLFLANLNNTETKSTTN